MHLEQDLHVLQFIVDFDIRAIDQARHGRLRNPCGGLVEDCPLNPIEEIAPIPKNVFNHPAFVHLVFKVVLPALDLREPSEIPLLRLLCFVHA